MNNQWFSKIAVWLVIALVLFTVFKQFDTRGSGGAASVGYSDFLEEVRGKRIRSALIQEGQGGTEIVLVSLLPALGPLPGSDLDLSTVDRAVLRDLRLMQASPEQPPPAEQRVAIERLFMLPLRSALDRAPRPSRLPDRAQA